MAKVVLVWNEHPTEVVAGFHARKVAEILRKKYGHEVVMEKVPVAETNYGIVAKPGGFKRAAKRYNSLRGSEDRTANYAAKHRAHTFNFHATSAEEMGQAQTLPPKKFRIAHLTSEGNLLNLEIALLPVTKKRSFIIEIPGIFHPLPKRLADRIKKRATGIGEEIRNIETGWIGDQLTALDSIKDRYAIYHGNAMNLRIPQQQKYLHPVISEKIAAAIRERVSRK